MILQAISRYQQYHTMSAPFSEKGCQRAASTLFALVARCAIEILFFAYGRVKEDLILVDSETRRFLAAGTRVRELELEPTTAEPLSQQRP